MFKKIMENIKEYFAARQAMKTMALLIMSQYSNVLAAEKEAREAEKNAYESMKGFGDSFDVDDLRNLVDSVSRIAGNPDLTTDYYKQVSAQAHEERMAGAKAVE